MTDNEVFCSNCGSKNDSLSKFCVNCGSPLNSDSPINSNINKASNINSNVAQSTMVKNCKFCGSQVPFTADKCPFCGEWLDPSKDTEEYKTLIVLGYVFAILFPLAGLIISIYLLTRENESAKRSGKIQLFIIIGIFVVVFLFYLFIFLLAYGMY